MQVPTSPSSKNGVGVIRASVHQVPTCVAAWNENRHDIPQTGPFPPHNLRVVHISLSELSRAFLEILSFSVKKPRVAEEGQALCLQHRRYQEVLRSSLCPWAAGMGRVQLGPGPEWGGMRGGLVEVGILAPQHRARSVQAVVAIGIHPCLPTSCSAPSGPGSWQQPIRMQLVQDYQPSSPSLS